MKINSLLHLIGLCAALMSMTASARAQGTVKFDIRVPGIVVAPVYGPEGTPTLAKYGNTAAGTPSGAQTYAGALLTGTGFSAQLWAGPLGTPEVSLVLVPGSTTTFRTGATFGGTVAPLTNAIPGVPSGGMATVQVRAWDNVGGTVTTWFEASTNPAVASGASASFTVGPLGSDDASAANLVNLRSFNIHLPTPPSVAFTIVVPIFGPVGTNVIAFVRVEDISGLVQVGFYLDSQLVFQDTASPYTMTFGDLTSGSHSLTAVALSRSGLSATSAPVILTITNEPGFSYLVRNGSDWKYLDNGSDQGAAWRAPGFDDSGWNSGPAELGYGDSGEDSPRPERTVINGGPATNRIVTTYFRRAFNVPDPGAYSNLVVRLLRDDGAVVYLNGVEVFRSNIEPVNPISFTTLSPDAADDGAAYFTSTNLSPALLVAGQNLLAVEIHQSTLTSSDLSFDAMLLAQAACSLPPVITCPGAITTNIPGSSVVVNYANPTVTGGTLAGCTPPSGSVFPLGTTLVTCTATNACGTNICNFNVTVQQNAALTITCATNKTGCGAGWSFDTPIAVGGCNATVTNLSTVTNSLNPLTITRSWRAYDTCSNTATCSQTITVPPLALSISIVSNKVVLSWDDECCVALEEADQVTGPWYTVFHAFSQSVVTSPGPAKFYRLRGGSLTSNSAFSEGNAPGPLPGPGHVDGWFAGYGQPVVYNLPGCADNGFIRLAGNQQSGQGIAQTLSSGRRFKAGHNYQLSFCARYVAGAPAADYVQVRAVAFNGSLPAGTSHPQPGTDLAIMDVTAPLTFTDWTQVIMMCWKANQDFDSLAINAQNEANSLSVVDIDNICLLEVFGDCPCEEAQVDADGNVIPPGGLDPDVPPTYDEVDQANGSVHDLYGQFYDTSTAIWYPEGDPCVSIGGTVPDDAINVDVDAILLANGITVTPLQLSNYLAIASSNALRSVQTRNLFDLTPMPVPPYTNTYFPGPATNLDTVFCGQDIVFVHGLMPDKLLDILNHDPRPFDVWPAGHDQFYNDFNFNGSYGYWKQAADYYWSEHIGHFLDSKGKKNRYLTVAHAVTQGFEYGTAAMFAQIADAMNFGQGVVYDPADPRGRLGFGANGYVVVTHSDGALLTDVAMSIANLTRIHASPYYAIYGDASFISDYATAHIALHGAFSGSREAAVAYAIVSLAAPLNDVAQLFFKIPNGADYSLLAGAVLDGEMRDMVPLVAQQFWGLFVDLTPVRTITIAGGHPSAYGDGTQANPAPSGWQADLVKLLLLKGYDDGVVNMDSATANPNPAGLGPSVYLPIPSVLNHKVFDMGMYRDNHKRAIAYYLEQTLDARLGGSASGISAASVPDLSPAGMVQPVLVKQVLPPRGALNRYRNHYSLLQTSSDHIWGPLGPYNAPDYRYEPTVYSASQTEGDDNVEEVFAVTDPGIYLPLNNPRVNLSCPLVNPALAGLVEERIKGRKVGFTFKFFGRRFSFYKWIWKRKYHVLQGSDSRTECDYVYDYVLRP